MTIKQWNSESPERGQEEEPMNTILGKVGIQCNNGLNIVTFIINSNNIQLFVMA